MMTKAISEEHFIRVVYDYLTKDFDQTGKNETEETKKIVKEMIARIALELHKDYWYRCEWDSKDQELKNQEVRNS